LIVERVVERVLPPDELTVCAPAPPPRVVATLKDLLTLANELKAAGADCRGKVAELRPWKESEK